MLLVGIAPGYGTLKPRFCSRSTKVSNVDSRSKSRASSSVCRNIWEKSGKSLFRSHEHLATLLGSGGLSKGRFLDGPGNAEKFIFLNLKWSLFIRTIKHYTLCGSINYCVFYGLRSTQKSSSQANSKSTVANWHTVSQTFTRNAHFVAWIKPWIRTIECFLRHRITNLFCFGI